MTVKTRLEIIGFYGDTTPIRDLSLSVHYIILVLFCQCGNRGEENARKSLIFG